MSVNCLGHRLGSLGISVRFLAEAEIFPARNVSLGPTDSNGIREHFLRINQPGCETGYIK